MCTRFALPLMLLVLSLCRVGAQNQTRFGDPILRKRADSLARACILIDGHVDLPYRLKVKNFRYTKEYLGIPLESGEGDFDYVRAKAGGLDAPFMSVYIPAAVTGPDAISP